MIVSAIERNSLENTLVPNRPKQKFKYHPFSAIKFNEAPPRNSYDAKFLWPLPLVYWLAIDLSRSYFDYY